MAKADIIVQGRAYSVACAAGQEARLEALARAGKRVVGMDLVEVSPGPDGDPEGTSWDAIVGARLLYRMIRAALS